MGETVPLKPYQQLGVAPENDAIIARLRHSWGLGFLSQPFRGERRFGSTLDLDKLTGDLRLDTVAYGSSTNGIPEGR